MREELDKKMEETPRKKCLDASSLLYFLCFQFERFPLLYVSLIQILGIIFAWKSVNIFNITQVYALYLPVLFLSWGLLFWEGFA